SLATVFQALGCKDLQLEHLKAYVKSVRKKEPESPQKESQDQFADRVARLERIVLALEKDLQNVQDKYEILSVNLRIVDRAKIASRMGLCAKALDILLKSDIAAFGVEGMDIELKLLLITGAADKV